MDNIESLDGQRIAKAVRSLPREHFIELSEPSLVAGHSIPPTHSVMEILDYAQVKPGQSVLQVGTGAGYLAALLSKLAAQVVTLENNPAVARLAQERFNKLGLANVIMRVQDGTHGAQDLGPFDCILVSSPRIRDKSSLLRQLADDGSLLALEEGENNTLILARYNTAESGAARRRELALVDFGYDSAMTLLDMGMVDREALAEAQQLAREQREPVFQILRKKLDMEDATLYQRLAAEAGVPFSPVEELLPHVQPELMRQFSRGFLDGHHLIPIRVENNCLYVATDDPDSSVTEIYHMFHYERVLKTLVTPGDFKRLWTTLELSLLGDIAPKWGAEPGAAAAAPAVEDEGGSEAALLALSNKAEARLVTLFNALLLDAVTEGASDLHVEQYKERTRIRLRVDGDLLDLSHYVLSPRETRGLINVIKVRCGMDIAEKRLPQGGRSQLTVAGVDYDLRIQVQPSLHGEAVVIRILPQSGNIVAIEDLGMSPVIMNDFRRLIHNPSGLLLVVGPTGSGKSTTLYAGLSELGKDPRRKVLTIEDPIEYSMDNIQQTWVRPDIGFNFADGMRSFVRLDPDVILVGEIRDHETALEAIRASQTGHMVFSTLHSNDAVDALQRIFDLDVNANSVASELLAVIAQRLAKRVCSHCKTEVEPDPGILRELFPDDLPESFRCFEGAGCKHCNGRGTRGRVAVVEYMQVNSELRNAIALRVPTEKLRAIALDNGLTTMRDSALNHVIEGNIPLSELPRILPAERMAPEKRGEW